MKRALFLVLVLVATGCSDGPIPENEIRVFAERYEFRGDQYASIAELKSALDTDPDSVLMIVVSECASDDRVADLGTILRQRKQANVALSKFSDDCD